jgi:hypothetical protein
LAQLLKATNRLTEAEPLKARVVAIVEKALGKDHPNVATALNNLAHLLQVTNRLAEAEPVSRRAVLIFLDFKRRTTHDRPHWNSAVAVYQSILKAMGRTQDEIRTQLDQLSTEKP